MSVAELQNYTFVSKYARWIPEKKRRETWKESVDRVKGMMLEQYPEVEEDIEWAYDMMHKKRVLGSQRALQFGGTPILKHNARIYNCLGKETSFITITGVKTFQDFEDGDEITVLTHLGNWKNAIVRNYGKQTLKRISFSRNNGLSHVWATSNHRWILKDGTVTNNLSMGDSLYKAPDIFSSFNYDDATPEERLYWCYGFVYGDGTQVKNADGKHEHSMVRLCGHDVKYTYRFEEMGFKTSTSMSLSGDFIAYTGKYLKTSPNPDIDSPDLIKAFVRGYLDADGTRNRNKNN